MSQSHGYIWANSIPGKGTTFTVLLPKTASPGVPVPEAPKAGRGAPAARSRILVVDDEDVVRMIIARTLELEQYQVVQARNGREAFECLARESGNFDLVERRRNARPQRT